MAFKWLNKQGVESDRGFVVQITGRFSMEYRSNGRKVKIDIELGADQNDRTIIILHANSISNWESFLSKKKVSEAERKNIIEDIREALEFQEVGLQLA